RIEADPGHTRRAQDVRPPAGGRGGGVRLGNARPRTRMGRGGGPGDPRGGATTGAGTGPAGRRARPAAGGVRGGGGAGEAPSVMPGAFVVYLGAIATARSSDTGRP